MAIKSRGVRLKDYPELFTLLGVLLQVSGDFVVPPKHAREINEVRLKISGRKIRKRLTGNN